jgi:hypothetical protein
MNFRIKTNEINKKAFKIQRFISRMTTGLSSSSGEAILEVLMRRFQTQQGFLLNRPVHQQLQSSNILEIHRAKSDE